MNFGAWNIRILMENPQRINYFLTSELKKLNADIRRTEEGQLKEKQGQNIFFHERINEDLMALRIRLGIKHATIISTYGPTLDTDDEVKKDFYSKIDNIFSTPKKAKPSFQETLIPKLGKDNRLWNDAIGGGGVGKINAIGIFLLTKCAEYNLVTANTLFQQKNRKRFPGNIRAPIIDTWVSSVDPDINNIYTKREPALVLMSAG